MKKSQDRMKTKKEEGSIPEKSTIPQSNNINDGVGVRNVITDPRFSSAHTDYRFQNVPKQESKFAIDPRFKRILTDKSFASSSAPTDKRGKRKMKSNSNSLRCYYRVEDEPIISDQENNDEDASEEKNVKVKLGQGESDSDDDHDVSMGSDEEEESNEEDSMDEKDAFVENVPVAEEVTHRLAIVNMDWRHFTAVHLYVVFSTDLPKDCLINSLAVYPTEFGIKRMEEEAIHGPVALFGEDKDHDDEDTDDELDEEKLRAYEQSKLSYFYAVVDCDSSATADHLYKKYDGLEFERSSNIFDLRFIPDGMEFKHPPRDIATERPSNYEGLDFYTRELQHSKAICSWDEDDPDRAKKLKRKFTDDQLAEYEYKAFLASDDSEVEENENDGTNENEKKNRYLALLLPGGDSDKDGEDEGQDMEATFNTGLEDLSKRILEKKDNKSESYRKQRERKSSRENKSKNSSHNVSSDDAEELIEQEDDFFIVEPSFKKERSESDKKEKHQMDEDNEASTAELELLVADDTGAKTTNLKGYNLKRKRARGKKENHVPEEKLPTTEYDDRFSALFTSPIFALDPTDPNFKRTKSYMLQLALKQQKADNEERGHKKREIEANLPSDDSEAKKQEKVKLDAMVSNKEKYELSSMVKSIKMKSKQLPSDGGRLKKHTNHPKSK